MNIVTGNDSRYTQCKLTYAGGNPHSNKVPRFVIAWLPAWMAQRNNRIELPNYGHTLWCIDEVRATLSEKDVYEFFSENLEQGNEEEKEGEQVG